MMYLGKLPFGALRFSAVPWFGDVLAKLLHTGPLPPIPPVLSWKRSIADNAWGELGNDKRGDCTVAAACHMMQCWSDNVFTAPWQFAPPDVLADFDNYRDAKDAALMQTILYEWRKLGVHRRNGAAPVPVQIDSYALLNINEPDRVPEQVRRSVQLLGGCYVGVMLPIFAVSMTPGDPTPHGKFPPDWNLTADQIKAKGASAKKAQGGGHCISIIGYDASGLDVVTWGQLARMSWDFFSQYRDEAWAILCLAGWTNSAGNTPSGLTTQRLRDAFGAGAPRKLSRSKRKVSRTARKKPRAKVSGASRKAPR